MYFLDKHCSPNSSESNREFLEKVSKARQSLIDAAQGLVFEAETHKYFFYGIELPSVSAVVSKFAPFDSEGLALKCSKNPKHKFYGKTPEEILQIWDELKNTAATAGTQVHEFGEACCDWWTGNTENITGQYRKRITEQGLMAESPKEIAVARWWNDLDTERYIVVNKETRIVNPLLGYAGTFDLLLFDKVTGHFLLKDYKTNEDLFKSFGDHLQPPLNFILANDVGKYTVQQNLYRIQLENIGLTVDSANLIWLKADSSYQEVEIDAKYRKAIEFALSTK